MLKIAFETAKTFLVLAKMYTHTHFKYSASGILLGRCHRGREAELGSIEGWEGETGGS